MCVLSWWIPEKRAKNERKLDGFKLFGLKKLLFECLIQNLARDFLIGRNGSVTFFSQRVMGTFRSIVFFRPGARPLIFSPIAVVLHQVRQRNTTLHKTCRPKQTEGLC